jgi:anaerobic dimethyl sulfoxide reductase subunit B (iron-sulfur subunit)
MTYAFTFDASSCSGCKACQAACKDKNQLPLGVLWRRVYEVSGGGWEKQGNAWINNIFAYNMSIACNHCEHPKCAGVCPVDAYNVRDDGIVYIDTSKCVGCGYCAWACPYGAPQYNHELGHMTKCNFCFDNIDAGQLPACVAACPLRVLNYVDVNEFHCRDAENTERNSFIPLWEISASEHPFPMYPLSRTEPHLAVKPHAAMKLDVEKKIGNYEEIRPRKESAWDEVPLVIFTLLAQLSVGAFWFALLFLPKPLTILPLSIIGLSLGVGMFFSFAHLGTKKNAWRAILHLKKSWLSREILTASLFGAGWLAVTEESLLFKKSTPALLWLTALLGFAFIYSMGQVYRLRSKPMWNTWRTSASFFVSAILLGSLGQYIGLAVALIATQWVITGKWRSRAQSVLNLAALLVLIAMFFMQSSTAWSLVAFFLVLAGESVARWNFYQAKQSVTPSPS